MKKALSVILTAAILAAVLCVGTAGASAMTPGMLNTYTPPAGLQTQRVMFAMPGAWLNEYTQAHTDNVVGIYWWTGIDAPSALDTIDNSHGNWPGYKADKMEEPGVDNLWYCDIAAYTPYDGNTNNDITHIVWNNYVLGDPDDLYHPNQTEDIFIEFWAESLNNHFSHLFGNTEVEWGSYADNYFYDAEYGNCLTLDNMVYVIEPGEYGWNYWVDRDTWLGRFYFYYGGGDYGVWPTKAQNTAMNGAGGNFMTDDYYQSIYRTPDNPTNPTNPTDPTVPTQPAFDPDTHYCTGEHTIWRMRWSHRPATSRASQDCTARLARMRRITISPLPRVRIPTPAQGRSLMHRVKRSRWAAIAANAAQRDRARRRGSSAATKKSILTRIHCLRMRTRKSATAICSCSATAATSSFRGKTPHKPRCNTTTPCTAPTSIAAA